MDNSRVVRTKRSFYGARASPYDRSQSRPAVPASQDEGHKSGLMSRVFGFFRPQKADETSQQTQSRSPANSPQNRPVSALYPVIDRSRAFEEPQMEEEEEQITETAVCAPRQTPPRPYKRISLGPDTTKSPNQRLAEFFEKKGDTPLSDVETAGVLALINEAANEDPSLAEQLSPTSQHDRAVCHSMSLANLAGRNETYGSPSKIPRRMENTSGRMNGSGGGVLKKSRSMASLGQRNGGGRVSRSSLGGIRGRPSPIMSSPKRNVPQNSRLTMSPGATTTPASTSTPVGITSPASSSVSDRPLSGVASTLLSLIDDDEDEVGDVTTTTSSSPAKEFINPYASSPRRPERERSAPQFTPSSRDKLMTPSPEKKKEASASPSKTPSQVISQSMPLDQQRERDSVKAQPQMKKFDKYKPVRSSNLRDSFVADPKSPENKKNSSSALKTSVSSSGSPESMPPAFTFGNKNNNSAGFTSKLKSSSPSGDEDTDVKIGKDLASSAAIRSPSKPLYPEISKDKPVLPSTPKLAKAGIPSTPQSEAAKKYGRDFDFSTPLKGEAPKPLTPADKSKVDQFKREFVF